MKNINKNNKNKVNKIKFKTIPVSIVIKNYKNSKEEKGKIKIKKYC